MPDKGDYHACEPSEPPARILAMRTTHDSDHTGEGRALTLVPSLPAPVPWYAPPPMPARGRRELEDEHTRILARAVGDHLPYELVLRAAELAAQLQRWS
jgi:hypothetical protein